MTFLNFIQKIGTIEFSKLSKGLLLATWLLLFFFICLFAAILSREFQIFLPGRLTSAQTYELELPNSPIKFRPTGQLYDEKRKLIGRYVPGIQTGTLANLTLIAQQPLPGVGEKIWFEVKTEKIFKFLFPTF
jgi:hypothetical protein